ncbi:hypothetical protein [Polaribacter tangerinus]|uniref:hypothetical protein n=1 Tax=Polaribacter tangerinus TaxID=1920034 RepID=UPI000B4BA85C|nr:hypothetical protein [Polaribacter tangerinus]
MKLKKICFVIVVVILCYQKYSAQNISNKKSIYKDELPIISDLKNKKPWYVPDYVKTQFAGNIGLFSFGVGYEVIDKVWFSELLFGFVPESITKAKPVHLVTFKNSFSLTTKNISKTLSFSPIVGFTTTLETNNNSFITVPDIYPSGYYITNAVHFTLFGGVSFHKNFTNDALLDGVNIYFELGTVETYLWYLITSKEVGLKDVFSTAIGINFHIKS